MKLDIGKWLPILIIVYSLVFPLFDSSVYFGILVASTTIFLGIYLIVTKLYIDKTRKMVLFCLLVLWVGSAIGMYFFSIPYGLHMSLNNLGEYFKLPYYFLLLLVFFNFFDRVDVSADKIFMLVFLIISFIGFLSLITPSIALLYTSPKMVHVNRLSAPFINPYTFAFTLSFYVLYFFSGIVLGWRSIKERYASTGLFFISFVLLLLTQSRSIVFSLLLILGITPLLLMIFIRKKSRNLYGIKVGRVCALACLAMFIFYVSLEVMDLRYTAQLFEQITNSGRVNSGSVEVRINQIFQVFTYFGDYPLTVFFGFGPAKDEFRLLESGYAYILYRHGFFGVIIYSCLFIFLARRASWVFLQNGKPLFLGSFLFILSLPLLLSSSMHIEHPKASMFFIMLIALITCKSSDVFTRKLAE